MQTSQDLLLPHLPLSLNGPSFCIYFECSAARRRKTKNHLSRSKAELFGIHLYKNLGVGKLQRSGQKKDDVSNIRGKKTHSHNIIAIGGGFKYFLFSP